MVSIIIPARNEQFLQPTIKELLSNARGEVEVIAVLDGYWPTPPLKDDPRLRLIHIGESKGMRNAINSAVAIARGEYIMKLDAHCMVGEGYDIELAKSCKGNYVVVPRRKRLDAENWCIQDVGKPDIDYMYLSYPDEPSDFGGVGLNGKVWDELNKKDELRKQKITDLMSFQGSCWFMKRDYFYELELMDEENYGEFWNEAQEIGLKAWLSGGRVIRNKNTWYAHLHKGKKYGRGYFLAKDSLNKGSQYTARWMQWRGAWDKQTKPLSWLIKKFNPPTWDDNKIMELEKNGN